MSLRKVYDPVPTEDLRHLLSETHTPRRRKMITTILAERGVPQLEWVTIRRGWQWNTEGWEISRHTVTHGYFDQQITVYRVWREREGGRGLAEFMEECIDLPSAIDFVQAFVDDHKAKTPISREN